MRARYHADAAAAEVMGLLEARCREAAQLMLERALEAEVAAFLGRLRYQRGPGFRGYRNGKGRPREIGLGTWAIPVRAPRVAQVPPEVGRFESAVLPKRRYWSTATQELFRRLYLEGLSSGDFEPVFRQLLGARAPLSASTIQRLQGAWAAEYAAWRQRPLADTYVYLWADGIYLGAGLEREASCLLTVVGATLDGRKEIVALELGYRESADSWAEVLRDLRTRGLQHPQLLVADGNLGIWAALGEVYPECRRQRCWNHRRLNVLDKLPKRLQPEARQALSALPLAPTRAACEAARDALAAWLQRERQAPAAETLRRDWEDFVTFYDFPQAHWLHLRTTNPIESIFAGVRLRTNVAKRMRRRENALYLVFKIAERLSQNWRELNGGPALITQVHAGALFQDGILQPETLRKEATAA